VKANNNAFILAHLRSLGAGAVLVSALHLLAGRLGIHPPGHPGADLVADPAFQQGAERGEGPLRVGVEGGAGLLLAEKIVKGRYETLDASCFAASRFARGELLREHAVI
jgi:hypothetical protein